MLYLSSVSLLATGRGIGSSDFRFRFLCCGYEGISFGSHALQINTIKAIIKTLIEIKTYFAINQNIRTNSLSIILI